jgi:hypothetical protein
MNFLISFRLNVKNFNFFIYLNMFLSLKEGFYEKILSNDVNLMIVNDQVKNSFDLIMRL